MKILLVFGLPILVIILLGVLACRAVKDHDRYDSY